MPEVFAATGRESVERLLSSSYQTMRIEGHDQGGGLRMTRFSLGPSARLDHNVFTRMSFHVTKGAPLGVLAIGYLRGGRAAVNSDGSERPYGPGDIFLGPRPWHPYTAAAADSEVEVTVLDPALLSQVAGTAYKWGFPSSSRFAAHYRQAYGDTPAGPSVRLASH